jgi:hypothetical protein
MISNDHDAAASGADIEGIVWFSSKADIKLLTSDSFIDVELNFQPVLDAWTKVIVDHKESAGNCN